MSLAKVWSGVWTVIVASLAMWADVVRYWRDKFRTYWYSRPEKDVWFEALCNATTFEEWEEAALRLDNILGLDMWRSSPVSKDYDYRLINDRLVSIKEGRQQGNLHAVINMLRSGLVRNLGNITSPKLFNCSFGGTKHLIEEYVSVVAQTVKDVAAIPSPGMTGGTTPKETKSDNSDSNEGGPGKDAGSRSTSAAAAAAPSPSSVSDNPLRTATMSTQAKLDFIHDTRQAFGRTALVLQGGSIFGLCHLGVVKALFLRGLLPRIIVGTATGAMMAALVAVHPEEDLPRVLKGDGIDLSAFTGKGKAPAGRNKAARSSTWERCGTLVRRLRRFFSKGYFLDVKVLEECIRTNVGDLTFEEAYNRSKRVLNITVATAGQEGFPTILNYVTAPNVLVWTAAVASNASSTTFYGERQTKIMCKNAQGDIVPWKPASTVDFRHWTQASYKGHNSPLQRVAELYNVNHFVVSQARPYLIPFLQSDMHGPSVVGKRNYMTKGMSFLIRMMGLEVRHRLRQLDTLRLLSPSIRRFLVDEEVPGAAMKLVPHVSAGEFVRLMETPTQETVDWCILRGEQGVWPAVGALRVRCAIEMELDRAYQQVRRLKAGGLRRKASQMASPGNTMERKARERGRQERKMGDDVRERVRAKSIGARCPPSAS